MKKLIKNKLGFFFSPYLPYSDTGVLIHPIVKKVYVLAKHPLISGATIIFLGGFSANICNFLFNLFMSRNLSFTDYGILASLFSLITLFALPVGAVIPTLVYFFASYFAKEDYNMARGLYIRVTKYSFFVGLIIFLLFFIFRSNISNFFHIENTSFLVLAGFGILISFLGVANQPLLQAKLAFSFLSFFGLFSSLLKLVVGVVFVLLGYSIIGVLFALIITSLIPYCLTFLPLRFLFNKGEGKPKVSLKRLFFYGAPATLATFGLTSFITIDIVLVKHFFSPELAGKYAMISLIGKVVFYFSTPIGTVMFPLIAQKYTKGENYHKDFIFSLLLVIVPSFLLVLFYILFPEFVVRIFNQNLDKTLIPLIIPFGVISALFAVLSLLTNFYLAIDKTKVFIPIVISTFLQCLLIFFFHKNFLQVILITLGILSLLLFVLLLYYWRLYGQRTRR